ncbi:MAG: GNAT family N-acetyltransferase [Bacteroidales bacterium]|nr:GNAT family N-acetyltransferase [Bacteroidales bacterium]
MLIDKEKIVIRRVGTADIDTMITYRIKYFTEIQGERPIAVINHLQNELSSYFNTGIQNGSVIALVAFFGQQPVAYGAMVLRRIPGDFNCPTYLEGDVLNMYTLREARRQGISTLILNRLIVEAKNQGVTKLSLHTTVAGEKLYRSAGFDNPVYPYMELKLGKE